MKGTSLEELMEMWSKDCKIREDDLAVESLKGPELHSKYLNYMTYHNMLIKKINSDYYTLKKLKTEYYSGDLNTDKQLLADKGWPPVYRTILKQDIPMYLESDPDLTKLMLKKVVHEEIVEYCKSVLKEIGSRGWTIRNAIEFNKFLSGQ